MQGGASNVQSLPIQSKAPGGYVTQVGWPFQVTFSDLFSVRGGCVDAWSIATCADTNVLCSKKKTVPNQRC